MDKDLRSRETALARRTFLRLMGRGFTVATFAGVTTGGLAGCGGGSSSTTFPGPGGPGNGPGTPSPTPTLPPGNSGPLTPESRMAAIQAVNLQMAAFRDGGNFSDQQVVNFLRSRPEFEDAGSVKPGGAWARFKDGELLIVSRNFVEPDPDRSRAFAYAPEAATRAAGKELPRQDMVHIFNALGTAFTPPHEDLRLWMIRHGYQLAQEREATIEALKNINNDGVFYINSHGDFGKTRDNTSLWALWTADEVSPEKDLLYKDLLADGSLVRFSAIHNRAPIQNPFNDAIEGNYATHYAITKRFVDKFNWRFGTNSLVFMNCCWSAEADFADTCIARGASVYAGWTNAANPPQAWRAARFLFDRLLGQLQGVNNEYPEPGGPQRAFRIGEVFTDLQGRGWDQTQTSFGNGQLIYGPTTGGFGLLAPSIKYVETNEIDKKLILYGQFGTDPGAGIRYVRINGTDLNVTKWENERIEADILPDQFGDVWVQIVARKSNIRQLTRWEGVMDYLATGPQTLKQTAKIHYRIRADVGKFRNEPGGPLQDRQVTFFGPDGENSHFVQWTGEGDVVATELIENSLTVRGTIDTATRQLRMEIIPISTEIFKYRFYGKFRGEILGGFTDELRQNHVTIADEELFDATSNEYNVTQRYLVMTLDGQWSLPAGERKADAKPPTQILIGFLDGEIKKIPTRLSWSQMVAGGPPRETESRSR
jgi:hypothetical protein